MFDPKIGTTEMQNNDGFSGLRAWLNAAADNFGSVRSVRHALLHECEKAVVTAMANRIGIGKYYVEKEGGWAFALDSDFDAAIGLISKALRVKSETPTKATARWHGADISYRGNSIWLESGEIAFQIGDVETSSRESGGGASAVWTASITNVGKILTYAAGRTSSKAKDADAAERTMIKLIESYFGVKMELVCDASELPAPPR